MITENELKALFSDENILKVMDEVLATQYKDKPRFTLLQGKTRTTILEFGFRPEIIETEQFTKIETYYRVPWAMSKEARSQEVIYIDKPSGVIHIYGRKFGTLQEAVNAVLYRHAHTSYLVNDATAIPIYF